HWFEPSHAEPSGSLGTQLPSLLQNSVAWQSASLVQPVDGPHVIVAGLHMLLRHCSAPVHGPSPSARPHLLSAGSQTPLSQTTVPAAAVHVPSIFGLVCPESVGTGVPFGSLGVHMCMLMLHQSLAPHSASVVQPWPHVLVVVSHVAIG